MNLHKYLGLGMRHLPGHLKSAMLSHPITPLYESEVWSDLLPEMDDSITSIDLTRTRLIMHDLVRFTKRLTGLREITVTNAQVQFGIHLGLVSVIRSITVSIRNHVRSEDMIGASWKSLSRSLVTLKRLVLEADIDVDLTDELEIISKSADWQGSWKVVEELVISTSRTPIDHTRLAGIVTRVKSARGPGHYLDIQLIDTSGVRQIAYR